MELIWLSFDEWERPRHSTIGLCWRLREEPLPFGDKNVPTYSNYISALIRAHRLGADLDGRALWWDRRRWKQFLPTMQPEPNKDGCAYAHGAKLDRWALLNGQSENGGSFWDNIIARKICSRSPLLPSIDQIPVAANRYDESGLALLLGTSRRVSYDGDTYHGPYYARVLAE